MIRSARAKTVVGVEVKRWPHAMHPPVLFDGSRLPFANRSFDLVYAIDVLHHCPEPTRALDEALRCSSRYFLIKDHTYKNPLEFLGLCVLDEIGNRRFKVPTLYRYQERWEWSEHLRSRGFMLEGLVHPAACHVGLLGRVTNSWQFVALWRRN
jgi:SAM-dependent methyltransferase